MDLPRPRELRTRTLQCVTTPSLEDALDAYRLERRWTMSAAIEQIICEKLGITDPTRPGPNGSTRG